MEEMNANGWTHVSKSPLVLDASYLCVIEISDKRYISIRHFRENGEWNDPDVVFWREIPDLPEFPVDRVKRINQMYEEQLSEVAQARDALTRLQDLCAYNPEIEHGISNLHILEMRIRIEWQKRVELAEEEWLNLDLKLR